MVQVTDHDETTTTTSQWFRLFSQRPISEERRPQFRINRHVSAVGRPSEDNGRLCIVRVGAAVRVRPGHVPGHPAEGRPRQVSVVEREENARIWRPRSGGAARCRSVLRCLQRYSARYRPAPRRQGVSATHSDARSCNASAHSRFNISAAVSFSCCWWSLPSFSSLNSWPSPRPLSPLQLHRGCGRRSLCRALSPPCAARRSAFSEHDTCPGFRL